MRSDQGNCSLVVDGRPAPIPFTKRTGGLFDSDESKYPAGGMGRHKALGGPQTEENVTLVGEYEPEDHGDYIDWLVERRGKGVANVTEQPLDVEGNANAKPDTWTGRMKSVNKGDYDSSSGDAREVEIEISTGATT